MPLASQNRLRVGADACLRLSLAALLIALCVSPALGQRRGPRAGARPRRERPSTPAEALFDDASALARRGTIESLRASAEKFGEAALLYRAAGQKLREADALRGQGLAYENLADCERAIEVYREAAALEQELGLMGPRSITLRNLGRCYTNTGRYPLALKSLAESRTLKKLIGDKAGEAETLINMALVHSALGNEAEAARLCEEALHSKFVLFESTHNPTVAHNIGVIFYNLSKSVTNAEEEREILSRAGIHGFGSFTSLSLAYLTRAFNDRSSRGDERGMAQTLTVIGDVVSTQHLGGKPLSGVELNVLKRLNLLESADARYAGLKIYEQALPLWRKVGDAGGEARTLMMMAVLIKNSGGNDSARELFTRASSLAASVNARQVQATSLGGNMEVFSRADEPRLAVFYGKQAVNIFQTMRSEMAGLDKETRRNYLRSVENVYRTLADLLLSQGRLPEAEQVLGLLKEEEYSRLLRRRDDPPSGVAYSAAEEGAVGVLAHLAELGRERGELVARKGRGGLDTSGELRLKEIDRRLLPQANAAYNRALEQISREGPKTGVKTAEVRDAQALMDKLAAMGPGAVALYSIVSAEEGRSARGWVMLVMPPEFRKAYVMDVAGLDKTVLELRAALRSPATDPRPAAHKLYRILFRTPQPHEMGGTTLEADLENFLKNQKERTLMWSHDSVLRYVPMAALSPDGEHYLVERHRNVVFTPASIPTLSDPVSRDWRALGLGMSEEHKYRDERTKEDRVFKPLAGVPLELAAIIREEGGRGGGVLPGVARLNKLFTYDAMLDELDKGFPVVHIASHFRYNPADPDRSFLLLGDGTHLEMKTFQNAKRIFTKTALVTLSACDTAMGADRDANGKDVEGLGFVAQRLGAQSVIASLWPVDDVGTQVLMPEFYRLRQSVPGVPKAEALRQAQLALLEGRLGPSTTAAASRDVLTKRDKAKTFTPDPRAPYAHPFYWAPFILIGNWQ